ncbi:MAG: dephospho-CoA kinase [Elusimicrobiota bacterium]
MVNLKSKPRNKVVIGITGGIACGKSTFTRALAGCLNAKLVLDADKIGHQVLKDAGIKNKLCRVFGKGIFNAQHEVDRKKLGVMVFGDQVQRSKLEAVVHPWIIKRIAESVRKFRKSRGDARSGAAAIVDATLIFEVGMEKMFDIIIVVKAPQGVQVERIISRDSNGKMTKVMALKKIHAQMRLGVKVKRADIVVDGVKPVYPQAVKVAAKINLLYS